jgi:nucleoside-triphosphatase THEP1
MNLFLTGRPGIGKMELLSDRFRAMITRVLDSNMPAMATLGISRHLFIRTARKRCDARSIGVSRSNRDELVSVIVGLLREGKRGEW